jgi:hypothetical protein
MQRIIVYLSILCCYSLGAQDTTGSITIKVVSGLDKPMPVENAKVIMGPYRNAETRKDGTVTFRNKPVGYYKLEVQADGYYPFPSPEQTTNAIGLAPGYRLEPLLVYLEPLPEYAFSLSGNVIDDVAGKPLDSVYVVVKQAGKTIGTAYTDKFGDFYLTFEGSDAELDDQLFTIIFDKPGYQSTRQNDVFKKENRYKAYQNGFRIIPDKLDQPDKPVREPESSAKVNMLCLGVSPEAQFYSANNEVQVQATSMFMLSYNFLEQREGLNISVGWHLPITLKTQNTFETLTGQTSEIETEYKIKSLGFFNVRYYHSSNKEQGVIPFISLMGQLQNQVPAQPIISEGTHEEQVDSYFKFVPRVDVGVVIRRKWLIVEPYLCFSSFSMESQNFLFNYFGRADAISVQQRFTQLGLGINARIPILNY